MLSKFFIYTNIWIALCATAGVLQSARLLDGMEEISNYAAFVFFSTLFLYGIHRIVGIKHVGDFASRGRFITITNFLNIISVLTLVTGGLAFYYFLQIRISSQLMLLIPSGISLLYVLPLLRGDKKRLRDLDFIKIFLIAFVWSWVTVVVPANELGKPVLGSIVVLLALERLFFLFTLAIPFDIRDIPVDTHTKVKTIPRVLGISKSKKLAQLVVLLMLFTTASNFFLGNIKIGVLLAIGISGILTGVLIEYSDSTKNDIYFAGIIDGMMILQFLLVWFLS